MKKIISLLFSLFLVIGLVACGGSSGSDDKETETETPTVEPEKPTEPEKPVCVPAPGEKC